MAIVGLLIVFASVILGYTLHGGKLGVLYQPTEYIIIGGAAIGSIIVASSPALVKRIINQLVQAMSRKDYTKQDYLELLMCLFEICKMGRQNLLGLEPHIEEPEKSDIFNRYPSFLKNHHAVHFLTDTMKVQIASSLPPFELEELMDADLKTAHHEENAAPDTIQRAGDAMPALGIVAAVLGVVITMGKLTMGKEVIGKSVAAALVGTFLGVLLSYGMFQPLASRMAANNNDEGAYLEVIKICLLAFAKEASPKICVEFARRKIPPEARPSFAEVDEATSNVGKAA